MRPKRRRKGTGNDDANCSNDDEGVLSDGCQPANTNVLTSEVEKKAYKARINLKSQEFIDNIPTSTRKVHIISENENFTLTKLNPWTLEKTLTNQFGKLKRVDYIKSGALIATCETFEQVKTLLDAKNLQLNTGVNIEISVNIALTNQTTMGKIYIPQMEDTPLSEMLEQLKPQGIINIQKILQEPNKKHIPLYI